MKNHQYTWGAFLFLLFIGGMFLFILSDFDSVWSNIKEEYQTQRPESPALLDRITLTIGASEPAINKSADRGHSFIQLFGGVQRVLGKRVIQDADPENMVVRLDNGTLQFIAQKAVEQDVSQLSQSLSSLNQVCKASGIPMMYLCAPSKVERGANPLPLSIEEYGNIQSDRLLEQLKQEHVAYLDLRETFESQPNYADYFFKTDHHWKPEGAFLGFTVLLQRLQMDYHMQFDSNLMDPDQYETKVYERIFLGSQGKRVGTFYAGVDDISCITPRFETNLTYTVPAYDIERSGGFAKSVLFMERVEKTDYFNGNPYTLYAGGDYPYAKVINHKNPAGPKILLVRDSFGCTLTPFLALACSELETIDLRHFKLSLTEYIVESKPDIVLFLYTTTTTNLPSMYQFS